MHGAGSKLQAELLWSSKAQRARMEHRLSSRVPVGRKAGACQVVPLPGSQEGRSQRLRKGRGSRSKRTKPVCAKNSSKQKRHYSSKIVVIMFNHV